MQWAQSNPFAKNPSKLNGASGYGQNFAGFKGGWPISPCSVEKKGALNYLGGTFVGVFFEHAYLTKKSDFGCRPLVLTLAKSGGM